MGEARTQKNYNIMIGKLKGTELKDCAEIDEVITQEDLIKDGWWFPKDVTKIHITFNNKKQ